MKKPAAIQEHSWKTTLAWWLRAIILLSGLFQIFFDDAVIGSLIVISLAIISFPSFFTRRTINYIPLEIEILLFIMVIIQLVIGEAREFYTNVPYYDKFVHYYIPMNLGLIGFLIFYTLYASGRLNVTQTVMFYLVVMMTLGLGAAWEIVEYANDQLILPRVEGWHEFQGNAVQDKNQDTMSDLVADLLGAIFGAILAIWYTNQMIKTKSKRFTELIKEMAHQRTRRPSHIARMQELTQFFKLFAAFIMNPLKSKPLN